MVVAPLLEALRTIVTSGPISGVLGGVISYFVLEVWLKRGRQRRDIAKALAAELRVSLKYIADLAEVVRHEQHIVPEFHAPVGLYLSLSNRLGELPVETLSHVVALYRQIEELNRVAERPRQEGGVYAFLMLIRIVRRLGAGVLDELDAVSDGRDPPSRPMETMVNYSDDELAAPTHIKLRAREQ